MILFEQIPEFLFYMGIAVCYMIFAILYLFSVHIAILWLILGFICYKLGRIDSAKVCYTIALLFSVMGLIIEIFLK